MSSIPSYRDWMQQYTTELRRVGATKRSARDAAQVAWQLSWLHARQRESQRLVCIRFSLVSHDRITKPDVVEIDVRELSRRIDSRGQQFKIPRRALRLAAAIELLNGEAASRLFIEQCERVCRR